MGSRSIRTPNYILGQPLALQLLEAALRKDRVSTAYCFVGPEGVGRSLTARWFAQALLCQVANASVLSAGSEAGSEAVPCDHCSGCHWVRQASHPDLLWVEPTFLHQGKRLTASEAAAAGLQRRSPPQIRLDQIQEIVVFAGRAPLQAPRSVVVVEGAETLAESAANALLKTLEEPGHTVIILIAPAVSALLPTLISRCQVIPFRRLSSLLLHQILAQQEYLDLPVALLELAQGSPGKALQALDQLNQIPADILEQIEQWPSSRIQALHLGRTIAKSLDVPSQLWLVDYLQHYYWQKRQPSYVERLEQIRKHLRHFVQPQLTWEINLSCGVDLL